MLPPQFEELADLVWALVNDRLDEAGTVRLEQLLDGDAANRRVYLELMDQFASLEWEASAARGLVGGQGLGTSVPTEVVSGQWSVVSESEVRDQKSDLFPRPVIPPSSSTLRGRPLAACRLSSSLGRLAVLLRGRHGDRGHGDPGGLGVQGVA